LVQIAWLVVDVEVGLTVIINVVLVAHCPAAGVNVYVVVVVLFNTGDHAPLMPFIDVVGNGASVPPEQTGATALNAGVSISFITTGVVAVTPGQPPLAATV
jgi:hypothetical protein